MARSAELAGFRAVAVVDIRVGHLVCRRTLGVVDATAHDRIVCQHQGIVGGQAKGVVVVLGDRLHVVAKVAGHALQLVRNLVQVHAIGGHSHADRHRCVAADAEVSQLAAGLLLASAVHRQEDRILGGVRMHAAGPLAVVVLVTLFAGLRVLELLKGEYRTGDSHRLVFTATSYQQRQQEGDST